MTPHALLVCRDPACLPILRRVIENSGLQLEVATGVEQGRDFLSAHKYECVLIDCDDMHEAPTLLKDLRRSATSRNSVSFAITNGVTTTTAAYQSGANFVLEKPLTIETASRAIRAGLGLIFSERRRYFRLRLESNAFLSLKNSSDLPAAISDISEGGMAIRPPREVQVGDAVKVRFNLPKCPVPINVSGEIAWVDRRGRAGVRFTLVSANCTQQFQDWITARAAEAGISQG